MSAQELITEHLDLWTEAVTKKSSSGRGSNGKIELTGIKKLRELILELAVRGKLVEQDGSDESVEQLLEKIEFEKRSQLKAKKIRKPKSLPDIQEVDYPFSIPKSWRYCRLNDIGIWGSGATPKRGNTNYYGGGIPWFKSGELSKDFIGSSEETITDLAVQETSVRMNQPGDVLIAMYGATIGKASILEVAGTTNQAVCACTPWQGVSNRFLLLLLKAYRSRFIAMGAGGAQPNISRDKIIATVIGLPPEQEQHRIVQKVDELMALCDRLEQQTNDQFDAHETLVDTMLGTLTQSENATELAENWARLAAHFDTLFTTEQSIDKLKQTILQLAVMGRLVEQNLSSESSSLLLQKIESKREKLVQQGKPKGSEKQCIAEKTDAPFNLPANWSWVLISELLPDFQNGASSRGDKSGSEVIVLRLADITNLNIKFNDPRRLLINDSSISKYAVRKGDILIIRVNGSADLVGRFIPVEAPFDGIFCDHFIRMRIDSEIIEPRFLALAGSANLIRSRIEDLFVSTAGQKTVNQKHIGSLLTPLPPIEEQHRIVQKVDELMALCDQLKERMNQAGETQLKLATTLTESALATPSGTVHQTAESQLDVEVEASKLLKQLNLDDYITKLTPPRRASAQSNLFLHRSIGFVVKGPQGEGGVEYLDLPPLLRKIDELTANHLGSEVLTGSVGELLGLASNVLAYGAGTLVKVSAATLKQIFGQLRKLDQIYALILMTFPQEDERSNAEIAERLNKACKITGLPSIDEQELNSRMNLLQSLGFVKRHKSRDDTWSLARRYERTDYL